MLALILALARLAVAVGAGSLGSLAGLGGGILLTPVLVLCFGIPFGPAAGSFGRRLLALAPAAWVVLGVYVRLAGTIARVL